MWKRKAYPTAKPLGASNFTKRLKARASDLERLGVELEFRRSNGKNLISIINENAGGHVVYDDKLRAAVNIKSHFTRYDSVIPLG